MKTKQLALALLTLVSLGGVAWQFNVKQATEDEINTAKQACINNVSSMFMIYQDGLKDLVPITLSKVKIIRTPERDNGNALAYDIFPILVFNKKNLPKYASNTMAYTCGVLINNGKISISFIKNTIK